MPTTSDIWCLFAVQHHCVLAKCHECISIVADLMHFNHLLQLNHGKTVFIWYGAQQANASIIFLLQV